MRELVEENRRRGKLEPEFELLDTGIFDADRYFDVVTEYAKQSPTDLLIRITVHNRGPEDADLHVLPQLWFRNTWSWGYPGRQTRADARRRRGRGAGVSDWGPTGCTASPTRPGSSRRTRPMASGCSASRMPAVISRTPSTSSSSTGTPPRSIRQRRGTKAAAHHRVDDPGRGAARSIRLRLSADGHAAPFDDFDRSCRSSAVREADAFYERLQQGLSDDQRLVQRQAFAGMIWSKQFFYYDVPQWLNGDPGQPPPPAERTRGRNHEWKHLNNADIISMPDKWEYPWYAAWDLAFHTISLAHGRSRVCEAAAGAADARVVHAPERPAARLRVGVRRRQSAGARVGDLARVPDGSEAASADQAGRPGRSRSSSSACSTS